MGGLTTALMILWIPTFTPLSLSFFALLGCLLAGVLIYIFSSGQKTQLIMTGVAISTLSSALTGLLLIAFAPAAGEAMIWLKGSLYSRNLSHLQYFLPWSVLTLACAYYYHHQLDLLQLEEESATNLGVPVTYRRACLFALACLLTAGSVSVAGGLAFVGLIAPHIARWSSSPLHRFQLPLTLLSGAALVLACDLLGRTLFSPVEIPVGLVTAILGAPYFLYLLMTRSL